MFSKLIPFFLSVILSASVTAQEIPEDTRGDRRRTQLGITASIDYTNRLLSNKNGDPLFDQFIEVHNHEEKGSSGYSLGAGLQFPVGTQSSFFSGLSFTKIGHQTYKRIDLQWPDEVKDGQYFPDTTRNDELQFFYRYYYLDVPLLVQIHPNYTTPWFFIGGITTNIFLHATTTSVYTLNGETSRSTQKIHTNFTAINITPQIGFGRQFSLNEQLQLQVAPVFRFGLIPVYSDQIAENTWSAGLNMHLVFGN